MDRRACLLSLLAFTACGAPAPAPASVEVDSASGQLHLVVHINAERGVNAAIFEIADEAGGAVSGELSLTVTPWMAQHSHGASVSATVEAEAPGSWRVTNLNLPMAGTWQLRTVLEGSQRDEFVPQVDVP